MLAARAPAAAPRAPARATGGAPRAATPKTVPSVAGGPAVKLRANVKNPRLRKVLEQVEKKAAEEKQHPPASQKAAEAQAAAQPPGNEKLAGAKAGQVGVMKEAPTGKPESNSFLDLLRAEIDKVMPKTLGDADNFMEGGQKDQLKGAVSGNVNQQSDAAASGIKGATSQAPDPSAVAGKEVTPMPAEGTPAPPAVNAGEGMPLPKTDAEISLQKSKQEVNEQMADAEVTPEQLKKANDPRFSAVLTAKGAVEKQADAAPKQYRTGEAKTLSQAVAQAQVNAKTGLAAVRGHRAKSGTEVKSRQQLAKEKDEAARKAVADGIESIYNRTKQAVEGKLATLEPDVMALFDKGVDAALATMKDYVDARMGEYKSDRYDRIGGSLLWAKDKLFGMPDEVNVFIQEGRRRFTQSMDALIVRVANLVETRLQEAKTVVAKGEAEVHAFVLRQPKDLQGVAKEAEKAVGDRFRELEKGIDEKKNDLAQKLAQRYKEASDKADAMKQQMEEENKGLVSGFIEKLGAIIKALAEFKDKLMGLLRKGWETIKQIIADPIGFLGNLISAIKQGVTRFKDNIWTHLKAGFMQWLFGSLADAGITLPKDLSLPSILGLVLSVLGLTYDRLRAKAVTLIGERNVKILEKLYEYVKTLITEGPAALWEKVKDDLSNLKAMVIDAIQDWIVTTIVKAAITKLVTMFNPAGAIIQAIMAIYKTVMFFIENASKIMALLEAVINSVSAIASGNIGGAATWIEQALARTIPVIIGFLARLIGLGGISDKIREIIKKVQTVVDKAIDKVLEKIVTVVKKLFGKGGGKAAPGEKEGAAAALPNTEVKTKLDMEGASHTLTTTITDGRAKTTIATDPVDLLGATSQAIEEVQRGPGPRTKTVHHQQPQEHPFRPGPAKGGARSCRPRSGRAERLPGGDDTTRQGTSHQRGCQAPRTGAPRARQEPSGLLQGSHAAPARAPEGLQRPRPALPPREFTTTSWKTFTAQALPTLKAELKALQKANDVQTWESWKNKPIYKIHPKAMIKDFDTNQIKRGADNTVYDYQVDHIVALADHWKAKGHNDVDAERNRTAVGTSNLRLITQVGNREKGADEKYQSWVGKEFTSKYSGGNKKNSHEIDGVAFEVPSGS